MNQRPTTTPPGWRPPSDPSGIYPGAPVTCVTDTGKVIRGVVEHPPGLPLVGRIAGMRVVHVRVPDSILPWGSSLLVVVDVSRCTWPRP